MPEKDSHCSYCGHPYAPEQPWPRQCAHCNEITYRNPLPVSVTLVPVNGGLLAVRRAIAPGKGKLALPGGFIEWGESWQEAGARELKEETGVVLPPQALCVYRVYSAPDGTLLVFGRAPAVSPEAIPAEPPTAECSELVLLQRPAELAFSLHTRVVAEYFAGEDGKR